jgi:prevent-host-death family protein
METTNSPGDTSEEEDRTYIGSTEFRKMIRKVLELVRFKDRRFVVNKHGEPQAAVVPMEDLEMLEYLENEADRQRLEELRDEDSETVSLEEFEQKFVDE